MPFPQRSSFALGPRNLPRREVYVQTLRRRAQLARSDLGSRASRTFPLLAIDGTCDTHCRARLAVDVDVDRHDTTWCKSRGPLAAAHATRGNSYNLDAR